MSSKTRAKFSIFFINSYSHNILTATFDHSGSPSSTWQNAFEFEHSPGSTFYSWTNSPAGGVLSRDDLISVLLSPSMGNSPETISRYITVTDIAKFSPPIVHKTISGSEPNSSSPVVYPRTATSPPKTNKVSPPGPSLCKKDAVNLQEFLLHSIE